MYRIFVIQNNRVVRSAGFDDASGVEERMFQWITQYVTSKFHSVTYDWVAKTCIENRYVCVNNWAIQIEYDC